MGLRTSAVDERAADYLFYPESSLALRPGERNYVAHGEANGVHKAYKCRVREPWYMVPDVRVPDLILSVFSERPVLSNNDGRFVASNSLLCGFLRSGTAEDFAASWYTSLTLLGCESEVHALGGGVMVLVPREAGNIRIANPHRHPPKHLGSLAECLADGDIRGAYERGDEAILRGCMGLSNQAIDRIRQGVAILAHWRTSARGGVQASAPDDSEVGRDAP
ncbi:MAG: hypothetical protein FJ087_12250 [Deltaproteobacteria bacterium]|nr:hypothetical protein [Deltaproteobacteria bacterium]